MIFPEEQQLKRSEVQNHARNDLNSTNATANGILDNDKIAFGKTPEIRAQNEVANDTNASNDIVRTLQPTMFSAMRS